MGAWDCKGPGTCKELSASPSKDPKVVSHQPGRLRSVCQLLPHHALLTTTSNLPQPQGLAAPGLPTAQFRSPSTWPISAPPTSSVFVCLMPQPQLLGIEASPAPSLLAPGLVPAAWRPALSVVVQLRSSSSWAFPWEGRRGPFVLQKLRPHGPSVSDPEPFLLLECSRYPSFHLMAAPHCNLPHRQTRAKGGLTQAVRL